MDDRRSSLTVIARDTIRAGDYVVVTGQGATRLTQTSWPGSGAILGRALERTDAGQPGRVRDLSPKAIRDVAPHEVSEAAQRAWAAMQRYTGWLRHDKSSNTTRAALAALGVVLDQHCGPEATAAAIAKVGSEVERLHAVDLKQLFRNALHDLSVGLDSPGGER
jgi:hypothetical protein